MIDTGKQMSEWQAITDEVMTVNCKEGSTNIRISDNGRTLGVHVQTLVAGNVVNNLRQLIYLPDDVRLCRKTQP